MSQQTKRRYKLPLSEQWGLFTRIMHYTKPNRAQFAWAIFFSFMLTVFEVIMPRFIQVFIDNYLTLNRLTPRILLFFGIGYLILCLLQAVVVYFNLYLFRLAVEKTIKLIRNDLYEKTHTLGMRFFDQTPAGWLVTRITNDTEGLKNFFNFFIVIIGCLFSVLGSIFGMLILDVQITVSIIGLVPVILLFAYLYSNYSTDINAKIKAANGKINIQLAESINGMDVVQQFRQEERLQNEFNDKNNDYYQERLRITRLNSILVNPIVDFLTVISLMIILGIIGNRSLYMAVDVGIIYVFATYVKNMFGPLTILMNHITSIQEGIIASERIFKVLDNDETVPQQLEDNDVEITKGSIEFKNVSFSYDGINDVLKDISFRANPGETVAFVGQTGSGKSSIINVLMRFYDFAQGEVLIDGHDIREYSTEELRDNIGLVLQDPFLFYGTIEDNIRLMDDTMSDETVHKAAEFVKADRFIEQLPEGYQQKVTERGSSYSSGQRQLISFASIMAREPKILILDEATANIDTETEQLIQDSLNKMQQNRTTITVAHRLSTIQNADQIFVLKQGEIVERGNHESLIKQNGIYKKMYEMQNLSNE